MGRNNHQRFSLRFSSMAENYICLFFSVERDPLTTCVFLGSRYRAGDHEAGQDDSNKSCSFWGCSAPYILLLARFTLTLTNCACILWIAVQVYIFLYALPVGTDLYKILLRTNICLQQLIESQLFNCQYLS